MNMTFWASVSPERIAICHFNCAAMARRRANRLLGPTSLSPAGWPPSHPGPWAHLSCTRGFPVHHVTPLQNVFLVVHSWQMTWAPALISHSLCCAHGALYIPPGQLGRVHLWPLVQARSFSRPQSESSLTPGGTLMATVNQQWLNTESGELGGASLSVCLSLRINDLSEWIRRRTLKACSAPLYDQSHPSSSFWLFLSWAPCTCVGGLL